MKSDKYGNMTSFKVDTTYVGKLIYTKSLSGRRPEDITGTYKHPEGHFKLLYISCDQSYHRKVNTENLNLQEVWQISRPWLWLSSTDVQETDPTSLLPNCPSTFQLRR